MTAAKDIDPMNAAFGMFLRGERLTRKIKQSQVARWLGVSTPSITYYERGMRQIPLVKFVCWCEALGLDPGETLTMAHNTISRKEKAT